MTPADREFYRQERAAYGGLWGLPMTGDNAAVLTNRLLRACGERPVDVLLVPGAQFHAAYPERIEYIANDITPQCVAHEVAHVIQYRAAGDHWTDHDEHTWNLVALVAAILEEVL